MFYYSVFTDLFYVSQSSSVQSPVLVLQVLLVSCSFNTCRLVVLQNQDWTLLVQTLRPALPTLTPESCFRFVSLCTCSVKPCALQHLLLLQSSGYFVSWEVWMILLPSTHHRGVANGGRGSSPQPVNESCATWEQVAAAGEPTCWKTDTFWSSMCRRWSRLSSQQHKDTTLICQTRQANKSCPTPHLLITSFILFSLNGNNKSQICSN